MAEKREALRESPAVWARGVLLACLGFLAFVILAMVGLRFFYLALVTGPVYRPPQPQPAPGLQSDPAAELARVQQAQREKLGSYAWVDRQKGTVRIPIDRAMQLIAARGAKGYDPLEQPSTGAGAQPGASP